MFRQHVKPLNLFAMALVAATCFAASAVKQKPQEIPPCVAYLTGNNIIKTPGPVRPEISALADRYSELHVGIGWGKGSHVLPLKIGAKDYEINRDTLPTVPKVHKGSRLSFVIGLHGRLKEPSPRSTWANAQFAVSAESGTARDPFYKLSSFSVDSESAEDQLLLYLTALNAAPYVHTFELTYALDASSDEPETFAAVREFISDGYSQTEIADRIAPPAIKSLVKSPIFRSSAAYVVLFKGDNIVYDPSSADSALVTYMFLLKSRPSLN